MPNGRQTALKEILLHGGILPFEKEITDDACTSHLAGGNSHITQA
jgi:hypothetical protein